MTLTISIGESRRSTHWTPKTVTWEQLCKKLMTPKVTAETVAEFAAMSKDQRGEIKDVGGYVGGRIEGGNRKAGAITDRQLVCLDADYGDLSLWDTWDVMVGKACLMHSSHSYTPDNPRLRFVIPLSRTVSAAEYEPIARRIAEWLNIEAFDDTTYEAARLMYWGSCSRDAEYICKVYPSDSWVDPDEVLATYEDWHDMSTWPTSSRQAKVVRRQGDLQGDPLTKPGVIGAFNRAYTITEAIHQYLPDKYVQVDTNRWTYTGGHTTGGAVTYDNDTFIYSHHDTDPISGRLCSAYDMVRLHLFGDLDEGSDLDAELPSVKNMNNLLQNDEKVRKELADAIIESPEDVFDEKTDLQRFTGDRTEQGLTVVLADTYGNTMRFNKSLGWLFWDGTRWVLDADAEISAMIMRYTDDLYATARLHVSMASDKADQANAKAEMMTATKMRTATGIEHVKQLLKPMVSSRDTRIFDANPWDLNTPDGIVDLRTGEMRAHDRKAYCTRCTAVSPGGQGAHQWLEFVNTITGGDQEFAEYLQTLAGMAAVGEVFEEGLVISFGHGSNGKSTFFGALKTVLGDYARTINADMLVSTNGNSDQSYVVALRGARLVILSETEESAVMSSAQLKRLTSRDVISARALYKDPMEFTPSHTTIMHTNHLPRISGAVDGGIKRRIAVAPFLTTFTPDRVITNYQELLLQQSGPAILRWVIEGAIRFYTNGCKLPKPDCVTRATKDYVENEDMIGLFIQDCCEVGTSLSVKSAELYAAYQVWCGTQGIHPKRTRDFAVGIETHGFTRSRVGYGVLWSGIRLHEEV